MGLIASDGQWKLYRHLLLLNYYLMEVAAGRVTRLLVTMPPRHGKSELISKYFPAWYLGTNPSDRVMLCGYEADFAATWGRAARDLLEEYGKPLFGVGVSGASNAAARWDIEGKPGGMVAVGVGGPIMGRGYKLGIIDDPYKSPEQANSSTYRRKIEDWYKASFYTRQAPGAAIIVVQMRWNQEDFAGYLLNEMAAGGEQWVHIDLPALALDNDVLNRQPGEALWPEFWPEQRLEEAKRAMGSYWFSAIYQQKPQPDSGSIFQRGWFSYFSDDGEYYTLHRREGSQTTAHRVEKRKCWTFQMCDPAATERDQNSFFVLTTWAVTPDKDLLLLDVFREHAATVKHLNIMKAQYQRWTPGFQGVEKSAYGLNIIQQGVLEGLPIRPIPVDADKVSRARPVAARYEVGTVFHRRGAAYLNDWEDELVAFDKGPYNDQVDNASMAGLQVVGSVNPMAGSLLPGMISLKGR